MQKMKEEIGITAIGSISALGGDPKTVWRAYQDTKPYLAEMEADGNSYPVARLANALEEALEELRREDAKYRQLDPSVLYAILASRRAIAQAGWKSGDEFGVNIGSSRGATHLFEKYYKDYLDSGFAATLASPTTTLGNIASWVGDDLKQRGPVISHSITCSTALHALLNGVAWLRSGLVSKFLVGGSEASLTPFTLAQMKALKIYAKPGSEYPCRALDMDKSSNSMVLGEGAAMACLETNPGSRALAVIRGIGYASEKLTHNISISEEASCFQDSMKMALGELSVETVDAVVMHAPGTVKGDRSEVNAIEKIFGNKMPALTSNKWKLGHTFGASGLLSLELGVLMILHQQFIGVPYADLTSGHLKGGLNRVMVNAVGFGGNAVSVLLEKPGISGES